VLLGQPDDFWIIPTRELVALGRELHERWLRTLRKDGRPYDPNSPVMVRLSIVAERFPQYLNAWHLIWESP
jgi:hypothetical protein